MNANAFRVVRTSLIVVAIAASLGACFRISDPSIMTQTRFGAISIKSVNGPSSTGIAKPVAVFFDATNAGIPDSRNQPDRCDYAALDSASDDLVGDLRAGVELSMKLGSQDLTLPFDLTFKRYSSGTNTYSYGIGDSVQVTVPGDPAGFPASAIAVKLAQPIKPGPVSIPAFDQPMNLTWNAVIDTTSAVVISLRYANPSTSTFPNQQILCALVDDGAYSIPASALGPFLASPNSKRSLVVTRWRTREATLSASTLLHIVSSIDTTIVFP